MTKKQTYSELLRHPKWQMKRLEILNRDNATCRLCGDTETELHIHHKQYIKGNKPWEYENESLITYCKVCHKVVEYCKTAQDWIIFKTIKFAKKEDWFFISIYYYDSLEGCYNMGLFKYDNSSQSLTPLISLPESEIKRALTIFDKQVADTGKWLQDNYGN